MNNNPYPKWVGVLLGIILSGSAHFLSGRKALGIKWNLGLFALIMLTLSLIAIPGTITYVLGLAVMFIMMITWCLMIKKSYCAVQRIGVLGWISVILVAGTLNISEKKAIHFFVQNFKISTGGMQPTICGIRIRDILLDKADRPGIIRKIFNGERYEEVIADENGILSVIPGADPSKLIYMIGSKTYSISRSAISFIEPGAQVNKGDVIWAGMMIAGDCVCVEKMSYRFGKPKRGDVVVFKTDGIKSLSQGQSYVKRVVGLPGERVRIDPPYLIVNDKKITEPAIFQEIASQTNGYKGFQIAIGDDRGFLTKPTDEITLGKDEYFVLGDNTKSSRDSRYWGPVPRKNIIGRVTRIYWPFNRINALDGK